MILRIRTRRWLLSVLVASTLIGALCAKLNTSGNLVVATATTHLFIDDPGVSIIDRTALPQDLTSLQNRAELYARLMTTPPVLDAIVRRAGAPPGEVSGVVDLTLGVPVQFTQAGSEEHANQLRASHAAYRLELQADTYLPILAIYAQAPSTEAAQRLANGAISGLQDYLDNLAVQQRIGQDRLPVLRQLEPARGTVTNGSARVESAGLTFVTAFGLSVVLMLAVRRWRRGRNEQDVRRPPRRSRLTGHAAADWPRTTRVLPWSIAVMIAMIWLTPFDRIQLAASGPVNITLDRIVIPVVVAIWLIAFAAGPGAAPRLRLTRVHVAVGAFLACAFLSVVLDAHYLIRTEEFTLALKKLPLLVSYMSIFVLVASSVRRSEVPAFMTYTLGLAVICGLGVIVEYRFHQNLFTTVADAVFKRPFEVVGGTSGSVLDSEGRRWVQGPAVSGLEVVAMLSMVLPIGVLGILNSKTRRQQIIYTVATGVLISAMFSTNRKSALVAPAAVLLTMAYFRRREMLSLAPLGLLMLLMIPIVSPGAFHTVVDQFTRPDASHVATVDSRTANYDAIRPDLWTHLVFGRGQGTYAPPTDRIIDSEILLRLVETGVLGLITFLLIPISVIAVCRKRVAERHPRWSAPALVGAAAGVCFIAESALYSVMTAPHAPDVFLYLTGLAVAVVASPDVVPAPRPVERGHDFLSHQVPTRRSAGPLTERPVRAG